MWEANRISQPLWIGKSIKIHKKKKKLELGTSGIEGNAFSTSLVALVANLHARDILKNTSNRKKAIVEKQF